MAEYERLKALIEEERKKNRQATTTWAEHINTISRLRHEAQIREQELGALRAILAALREPSEAVSRDAYAAAKAVPFAGDYANERVIDVAIRAALEAAERGAAGKDAGHA